MAGCRDSFSVGLLLSLVLSIHGTTLLCEDQQPCVLKQENVTCENLIALNRFVGTCCSLASDNETGSCTVTISNGHCFWEPRDHDCDGSSFGCTPEGIQYLSTSTQICPPSDFDPFSTEAPVVPSQPTNPPVTAPPIVQPTPTAPPVIQPTPTAPPVVQPTPTAPPVVQPTPTNPPVQPPTPAPVATGPAGDSQPGTGPSSPTVVNPSFPTPAPSGQPTVDSFTQFCGEPDGGPCELLEGQPCADFIATHRFVGSCCSLVHIAETGECIVRIASGHCYWEPIDGSCNPLYGGCSSGGIWYTSRSQQACPTSGFNVLTSSASSGSEEKEQRARLITVIWVSIVVIVVVVRVILCFAKVYEDKKNMEEEPEPEMNNRRPKRQQRDAEGGRLDNVDLRDQAQQHVLNQHSAYFEEELLAGMEHRAKSKIADEEIDPSINEIT